MIKFYLLEDESGALWISEASGDGKVIGEFKDSNSAELALCRELELRGE